MQPQRSVWSELQGLDFSQTYYNVGGIRTRSLEAGSGRPLIFLHGTGGHADGFLRIFPLLAPHFRVHAIDMVGHGFTEAIDGEIGIAQLRDHLSAFVDHISPGEPVFVSGESLGAVVASWYAIEQPQRVAKLVLNTGLPMPIDAKGKEQIRDGLERSRQASAAPSRDAVAKRLAWLMLDAEKSVTPELIDLRYAIYSQPERARALARIAETVMGSLVAGTWDDTWLSSAALARLQCPALVLWTEHNPGQSAERAREAAKNIPDHRMVILANSAHWPQWEEPEAFARHHLEFLGAEHGA